ncbi:hypothetical protein EDC04DRAFT_2696301, partial [Pisolithus marmoratus]
TDTGRERLMIIIERVPTNNVSQVISSSGGVARDTVTVVRVREHHEYWQRAGQRPVRRGTLRWNHPSCHLLGIALIASFASTAFENYDLYNQQCYWYSRIILAATARVFPPSCSEGVTSFSGKWFPWFGKYKPSHVRLLVKLHADYYQYFYPHQAPLAPTTENEQHAPLVVIPNIIHGLATFIAQLTLPDPETIILNRHNNRMPGGLPESSWI